MGREDWDKYFNETKHTKVNVLTLEKPKAKVKSPKTLKVNSNPNSVELKLTHIEARLKDLEASKKLRDNTNPDKLELKLANLEAKLNELEVSKELKNNHSNELELTKLEAKLKELEASQANIFEVLDTLTICPKCNTIFLYARSYQEDYFFWRGLLSMSEL